MDGTAAARKTAQENPWRFLCSLDGSRIEDRELLAATRKDELRVVSDMVASSRVSLLYAPSGNGKSSLLNAGVIPFFLEEGYAVFRTRPRPPFALDDPSEAMKECMLRECWLREHSGDDEAAVEKIEDTLEEFSEEQRKRFAPLLEHARELAAKPPADGRCVLDGLRASAGLPLHEFLKQTQAKIGAQTPVLLVCDQFEELFVHYQNTPQLQAFVNQLGAIYRDSELRIQFLFSMREDLVGNMIEFRRAIPDIFANYYKLKPINKTNAMSAVSVPAQRAGVAIPEALVTKIVEDLAAYYEDEVFSTIPYAQNADAAEREVYLELPAIQVVTRKLWMSSEGSLSLESYLAITPAGREGSTGTRLSPSGHVLNTYLREMLDGFTTRDGDEQAALREARQDLMYLLTDGRQYRRALDEQTLLRDLKRLRPSELNLPEVDARLLGRALKPLLETTLVYRSELANGRVQFELAHDFMVRSAVREWNQLDRQRTRDIALLTRHREDVDARLSEFETMRLRCLRALPWVHAASLAAIVGSAFYLDESVWGSGFIAAAIVLAPAAIGVILALVAGSTESARLFGVLALGVLALWAGEVTSLISARGQWEWRLVLGVWVCAGVMLTLAYTAKALSRPPDFELFWRRMGAETVDALIGLAPLWVLIIMESSSSEPTHFYTLLRVAHLGAAFVLYKFGIPSVMLMTSLPGLVWGATIGYRLAGLRTDRSRWRWLVRGVVLGFFTALSWHAISWIIPPESRMTTLLEVILFGLSLLGHAGIMYLREWPGFIWDVAADFAWPRSPEEDKPTPEESEPQDNVSRMFLK